MKKNILSVEHPELAKQWHPTKNEGLTPADVTTGSNKRVWWICGKGHEWVAAICKRAIGRNCPYCSGKRACADNCLQTLDPELAAQWHPNKNSDLTPNDVTLGSDKRVWWQCEKGHEWKAVIYSRTSDNCGCPYCSGRYAIKGENDLATVEPLLSKQWHPTKNGTLAPIDVMAGSEKKVWWLCERGHEWKAQINSRTSGCGCPYCSNQRVCADNCLQTLNPELAKQWHPTKNGDLTPNDVTTGSNKKVWWQCEKGHEWKAVISNRSKGRGCRICKGESQTSFPEQAVFFYLKSVFNDTISGEKYKGVWELDIFIPNLNLGIEYDGYYFHKNKQKSDLEKDKYVVSEGIHFIRIMEEERNPHKCYLTGDKICCSTEPTDKQLCDVIQMCFDYIGKNITHTSYNVDIDIKRDRVDIYDLYMMSEKEKSLLSKMPHIAAQWHPTRNLCIKPDMVKPNSDKRFWWLCEKGHEWQAQIKGRVQGNGCPYCAGQLAYSDNCLQTLNPGLAKQWHPNKNGSLTPNDVTQSTSKKVWWLCEKGHEWEASIANRSKGTGCPYCVGKRACANNCLHTLNPELSNQWHPTRNGILTPHDVTTGSSKNVWWMCSKGHEWKSIISNRTKGNACPVCWKKRS
jgi:translation initiation factor IF-1